MNKKKYYYVISIIIFIFSTYSFLLSNKCKPLFNFVINNKLNSLILYECINSVSIKENLKNILIKNETLFKISYQIKNKFFPNFGKKDYVSEKEEIKETSSELYFEKVINIKGIINNEKELKKISVPNKQKINFNNWFRSHANNFNNKYIETFDINKDNLNNLKLISKFDSIKNSNLKNIWESRIGINPIFAEGKIFFVTASWELVAISAEDYSLVWSKDFERMISRRGFLYHKDTANKKSFILINAGENLYKLNPNNGNLIKEFGNSGFVEVGNVLIPPVVYKNQIIVSNITESEVISVDLKTGKKNFSKNLHKKNNFYFYANPWGGAALDKKNGIYFVVTGNPKPAVIGVDRPGDNKNSCSIIAFDLNKKKILWTFQDVKHDLWDFDIAAPPILADIKVKEFIIQVVIITTKTGNTYVFDRKTGKSLFDINYKNTIKSNIPNEFTAPKQPEPLKPKKFSKIEFKKEDLREKFLNDKKFMEKFDNNHSYGWFQPPTIGKDIVFYGLVGGNNWVGSAYNPETQNLYVPSNHIPYKMKVFVKSREKEKSGKNLNYFSIYQTKCASCHGVNRNGKYEKTKDYDIQKEFVPSLVGLTIFDDLKKKIKPFLKIQELHKNQINLTKKEYENIKKLFIEWDKKIEKNKDIYFEGVWEVFLADDGKLISKPPWGTITSIQISDGSTNWKKPFGYESDNEIGLFNYGGISITSSNLLVATGAIDNFLTIIDPTNGKTLWKYKMEAEGTAAPLIYNYNGKTFIATLATGGLYPDSNKVSNLYIFGINK